MGDPITDQRLREIVADEDDYAEARCMAAELLAARAQLHADDQRAWEALGRPEGTHETTNVQRLVAEVDRLRDRLSKEMLVCQRFVAALRDLHETEQQLNAARAEVERLRASASIVNRVGWLDHLDTPEGRATHATEAVRVENEQLRADLRDALELLQNPEIGHQEWLSRSQRLAEKHKETNQ